MPIGESARRGGDLGLAIPIGERARLGGERGRIGESARRGGDRSREERGGGEPAGRYEDGSKTLYVS